MKLSIHLVTWNGGKYIPYLFDSLKKQTYKDWELIVLDNASNDDTVEKINEEIRNWKLEIGDIDIELIENKENKGFAGGHNQLYHESCNMKHEADNYVLLLNQDMYLMPDCLEKLVKFMEEHQEVAAISPRLMRWDFNRLQTSDFRLQDSFTNQIDSLGLKVLRNRRVIELGAGEEWTSCHCEERSDEAIPMKQWIATPRSSGARNDSVEVFGVSGALPMFRRSVIDRVGLFDESFKNYKEDVDLAFRLRSAGYQAYTILDAVAYHDRSATGLENLSDAIAIANKKNQSSWVKYHSYKNHLMVLLKNEYWQNYLLDLPWIKWYELKKFVYFLLFEPKVLKGLGEIWKMRKDLKTKRSKIKQSRKLDWKQMREILKKY